MIEYITLQHTSGGFGWHARVKESSKIWAASNRDADTAVYRAALRRFYGAEPKEGRSFRELISVFCVQIGPFDWVAVRLEYKTMHNEARELLKLQPFAQDLAQAADAQHVPFYVKPGTQNPVPWKRSGRHRKGKYD